MSHENIIPGEIFSLVPFHTAAFGGSEVKKTTANTTLNNSVD